LPQKKLFLTQGFESPVEKKTIVEAFGLKA